MVIQYISKWTQTETDSKTHKLDLPEEKGTLYAKHNIGFNKEPPEYDFLLIPPNKKSIGITYIPQRKNPEDRLVYDNLAVDSKIIEYRQFLDFPGSLPDTLRERLSTGLSIMEKIIGHTNSNTSRNKHR